MEKMEYIQGLISVIVPVYNVKNYLDRCIESILSQTYKKIEVLLIDDGSKDGSGEICDEWQTRDSRIQVFHKKNGGASSARNMGLRRGTLLVKGKGLPRSRHTPTRPGIGSTTWPVRHDT